MTAEKQRRRRWLQFSLRSLLILMAVACVIFAWPHIHRRIQVRQLAEFAGKDLRNLPDDQARQIWSLVSSLTSEPANELSFLLGYQTWYVWRPKVVDSYLIIFQGQQLVTIPGASAARVYMLDSNGNVSDHIAFSTGYRIDLIGATFTEEIGEFPILQIETERSINGEDIHQQYYAICDRRLELVRLEDSKGEVIPIASPEVRGVGPPRERPKAAEWMDLLSSPDRLKCLKGLATTPADSKNWLTDPQVKSRVIELSNSSDRWIAESATAFLRVIDKPDEYWWISNR